MLRIIFSILLTIQCHAQDLEKKQCTELACFPSSISAGDIKFEIINPFDFKYIIFDAYSIALYLPITFKAKNWDLDTTPKILKLIYHRNFSKEDFVETGSDYIKKNPNVDLDKIRNSLELINKAYLDIKVGDSYTIIYTPKSGLSLKYNDQSIVSNIPGADFAKAYFSIWLSKYGIDENMSEALLKAPQRSE